jgi:hypothetical protein
MRFDERLWSELAALADLPDAVQPLPTRRSTPTHRRRRLPRARVMLAGALAVVALAAAGESLFGPSGRSVDIPLVECTAGGQVAYSGSLPTPDPVAACAQVWPRLYHRAAPPLVAWSYKGRGVVIVTPADSSAPEPGAERLPAGWMANAALIELNDQTADITTGFPAHSCLTAGSAAAVAAGILEDDSLHWTVTVDYWRMTGGSAYYSRNPDPRWGAGTCLNLSPPAGLNGATSTVELHLSPSQPEAPAAIGAAAGANLQALERAVNAGLLAPGACATPAQAAAAWRTAAHAAGVPYADAEPLPPAPGSSRCARVFVSVLGGGSVRVRAADYP